MVCSYVFTWDQATSPFDFTKEEINCASLFCDASCNRSHYGSNWLVFVGKSVLSFYNWLLLTTNAWITPWAPPKETIQLELSAHLICLYVFSGSILIDPHPLHVRPRTGPSSHSISDIQRPIPPNVAVHAVIQSFRWLTAPSCAGLLDYWLDPCI